MALSRDRKKGRHELRRKRNRERMRRHKWTLEGKIGPEGKDLPHHHAWAKPIKERKHTKGSADASNSETPVTESAPSQTTEV